MVLRRIGAVVGVAWALQRMFIDRRRVLVRVRDNGVQMDILSFQMEKLRFGLVGEERDMVFFRSYSESVRDVSFYKPCGIGALFTAIVSCEHILRSCRTSPALCASEVVRPRSGCDIACICQ